MPIKNNLISNIHIYNCFISMWLQFKQNQDHLLNTFLFYFFSFGWTREVVVRPVKSGPQQIDVFYWPPQVSVYHWLKHTQLCQNMRELFFRNKIITIASKLTIFFNNSKISYLCVFCWYDQQINIQFSFYQMPCFKQFA